MKASCLRLPNSTFAFVVQEWHPDWAWSMPALSSFAGDYPAPGASIPGGLVVVSAQTELQAIYRVGVQRLSRILRSHMPTLFA